MQHQIWRKPVQLFRENKLIEYHQWEQSSEAPWVCEVPEPLLSFSTNRGPGNSKQQFWKTHGAVSCNFIFLYTSFLIQKVKIYQPAWNTQHSSATGGCQQELFQAWNWTRRRKGRGSQKWVHGMKKCSQSVRVAQCFRVKEPIPPYGFCWVE